MNTYVFFGYGSKGSNFLEGIIVIHALNRDEACDFAKERIRATSADTDVLSYKPGDEDYFWKERFWYLAQEFDNDSSANLGVQYCSWFFTS